MTASSTVNVFSRHLKHNGCSYRGSKVEIESLDQWGLEVLRVRHEIEGGSDCAGGGSIGGGSREIVLIVEDEDGNETEYTEDSPEFAEWERSLPVGTPDPQLLAELSAPQWDGSNHTSPCVDTLAALCGLSNTAYGYWTAADYLRDATISDSDTVDSLCEEAAEAGVYLDYAEVERFLEESRAE